MNILITGATGFIGKYLTKRLSELNAHRLFCLVRNPKKAEKIKPFGVKLIYTDIAKKESLAKILNYNIDFIFHCAGYVSNKNQELLHKVNVIGTENICELALKLKVKRLIYLSSVAVVSGNPQVPLVEELPFSATNKYGESKIEAEKKVKEYRKKGLASVIVRPCMVYGKDEPHMLSFLLFLLRYRLLPIIGTGENRLHLVYIKNLVDFMIFSLEGDEFLNESFFIADKEALTIKEVFNSFCEGLNAKTPLNIPNFLKPIIFNLPYLGKKLKFLIKDRIYSIDKIGALGFSLPYPAKESLIESAKNFEF